jgi:hypothetical protein
LLWCFSFNGTFFAICWILGKKVTLYISLSNQSCCFVIDLTFFLKLLSSLPAQNQIDFPALLFYPLWYLSCNLLYLQPKKVHLNIYLSNQSCCFATKQTFLLKLLSSIQVLNQINLVALVLCIYWYLLSNLLNLKQKYPYMFLYFHV